MDSLNESLCLEEFVAGCEPTTHTTLTPMTVRSLDTGPLHKPDPMGDTTILGPPHTTKSHGPQETDHTSRVLPNTDGANIKTEGSKSKSLKSVTTYIYLFLYSNTLLGLLW